jgi:hypothetical protein
MFACLDLKFHKELIFLINLKPYYKKPFQTFYYYYLKNFFEKTKNQNIIFLYLIFKPMQVCLQRNEFANMFIKVFLSNYIEIASNYYFYKIVFLYF